MPARECEALSGEGKPVTTRVRTVGVAATGRASRHVAATDAAPVETEARSEIPAATDGCRCEGALGPLHFFPAARADSRASPRFAHVCAGCRAGKALVPASEQLLRSPRGFFLPTTRSVRQYACTQVDVGGNGAPACC